MVGVNARDAEWNISIKQDIGNYLKLNIKTARLFRLDVPAARVAKDLGIQRPTAYRHYKLIRGRSAAERAAGLEKLKVKSIVYSDGWKAYHKLSLNGFHHRRINHDKTLVDGKVPVHSFENFWGYAKRRL